MENEIDPNLSPELKDIINRIKAYNVVHPEGIFVYHFVGWKKAKEVCEDCGEECGCVDENKSMMGAFGDLESVRMLINDLRDIVEDNQEDGFISF